MFTLETMGPPGPTKITQPAQEPHYITHNPTFTSPIPHQRQAVSCHHRNNRLKHTMHVHSPPLIMHRLSNKVENGSLPHDQLEVSCMDHTSLMRLQHEW